MEEDGQLGWMEGKNSWFLEGLYVAVCSFPAGARRCYRASSKEKRREGGRVAEINSLAFIEERELEFGEEMDKELRKRTSQGLTSR